MRGPVARTRGAQARRRIRSKGSWQRQRRAAGRPLNPRGAASQAARLRPAPLKTKAAKTKASKTAKAGKSAPASAKAKLAKASAKRKAGALKAKPKAASTPKARAKPKSVAKAKTVAKPKPGAKRKVAKPDAGRSPRRRKPRSRNRSWPCSSSRSLKVQTGRDWSETLFLPKTDFPMKAGLPEREPELLKRWERLGLYRKLREDAKGRATFVLHDGPPYANGHIHIGTGLNKILKDVIVRSQQMTGKDANYVPGWDCHGLPIEWKVEEENYRARGKSKPDLSDAEAMIAFRAECRDYAEHWLNVQREEFKRLGGVGDWAHPYTTMSFDAEATIAAELSEVRHERAALSRVQAGDVVGGRAHGVWPRPRSNMRRSRARRST